MEFKKCDLERISDAQKTAGKTFRQVLEDGEGGCYEDRVLMVQMFEELHQKGLAKAGLARLCRICQRREGACLFAECHKGSAIYCGEFELEAALEAWIDARLKGEKR